MLRTVWSTVTDQAPTTPHFAFQSSASLRQHGSTKETCSATFTSVAEMLAITTYASKLSRARHRTASRPWKAIECDKQSTAGLYSLRLMVKIESKSMAVFLRWLDRVYTPAKVGLTVSRSFSLVRSHIGASRTLAQWLLDHATAAGSCYTGE